MMKKAQKLTKNPAAMDTDTARVCRRKEDAMREISTSKAIEEKAYIPKQKPRRVCRY